MIFYIVMGGLFALYSLDLLMLVIVSTLARGQEVAALLKKRRWVRRHSKKCSGNGKEKEGGKKGKAESEGEGEPGSCKSRAGAIEADTEEQQPNLPDLKLAAVLVAEKGGKTGEKDVDAEAGTTPVPPPHRPSSERSSCSSPATPNPANPEPKPLHPTKAGSNSSSSSSSSSSGGGGGGGKGSGKTGAGDRGHEQAGDQGCPDGGEVDQEEQLPDFKEKAAGDTNGNARQTEEDVHTAGCEGGKASAPAVPVAAAPIQPTPSPAFQLQGEGSDKLPSNHSGLFSMGSSGGSSSFSSDYMLGGEQQGAKGEHELPALKMGGVVRKQGSAGDLKGVNMAAFRQNHSRSVSEVSSSEVSGSSAGIWETSIGGSIVHPSKFPLVLVQLPMFNEEAHAHLIIDRVCAISWPRNRLLIQVLDDSTKAHVRDIVDSAAAKCMEAGHPVQVLRRTNRQGYKAGAMVEGLKSALPFGFKYVAIFDADFEPPQDFLEETIGPLEEDPHLGFVQTRWLCPADSFLTWNQKINLGFHFDVEQRARSYLGWFFNFNGTAGVWRIEAIQSSGGWQSDTVVEDMDLSLRAYLNGWTAKYLPHVASPNEVPGSLSAYRTQQFRWLSGPMQIIVKAFFTIWRARDIGFLKRLNCYWFFARYILFALITLTVLAVPPVAMWLDPWEWKWPQIFFCASVNFALAVYLYITPFSIAYLIFSVAVGYYKTYAMLSGLIGSKQSKKWKVTQKTGALAAGEDQKAHSLRGCMIRFWLRLRSIQPPYALELGLMAYYGFLAGMAFWASNWFMGGYCAIMSTIFLVLSWGDEFM